MPVLQAPGLKLTTGHRGQNRTTRLLFMSTITKTALPRNGLNIAESRCRVGLFFRQTELTDTRAVDDQRAIRQRVQ